MGTMASAGNAVACPPRPRVDWRRERLRGYSLLGLRDLLRRGFRVDRNRPPSVDGDTVRPSRRRGVRGSAVLHSGGP